MGVRNAIQISLENQKTAQMLQRIDKDVIDKAGRRAAHSRSGKLQPWAKRTSAESFNTNLTAVIGKLRAAHIKTVIATSYAVSCNLPLSLNQNVAGHNDAIRSLAKTPACL